MQAAEQIAKQSAEEAAALATALRFGDTTLILSHRLSAWCGKGPALEEDLALANTALDLLGQARLWLSLAGELEGRGRDEDALAYHRTDREFRNVLLVEQPNGDYAQTLVRQLYFDLWHSLALGLLAQGSDGRLAAIAAKAQKEVAYHLRRSSDLVIRLGDGTAESHCRTQGAAKGLWAYTGELFAPDFLDISKGDSQSLLSFSSVRQDWINTLSHIFQTATLRVPPADAWMHTGSARGVHTEHLSYLLAEMQVLPRTYPGARW